MGVNVDARVLALFKQLPVLVDAAADHLDSVWQGHRCKTCKRKDFCGDRIA